MSCFLHRVALAAVCFALGSQATLALAARPSESLLPATTKGYLSVANLDVLEENFNKTQVGQLMLDPVMKPFADDLKRQLQDKWTKTHHKLGLTWEDMRGVPSGEFAVAIVQLSKTEAGVVIVADVTGRDVQAKELLAKVEKTMATRAAKRTTQVVRGSTVIIYNVPKKGEIPAEQAYYVLYGDQLISSDNFKIVDGILGRAAGAKDSLAAVPAFAGIVERCTKEAGDLAPHARWFVEPFGYIEASRVINPPSKNRKGTDYLKILKNQGFTAIQGLGGYVNFAKDQYEMLHRTAIWAPAVKPGPEKYELAARMLDLPNGGTFTPPDWIPREVAMFTSFNINMKNAFEASKTLVNEVVGDEVFEDVLKSILEDPNGPRIDIRKDLVGHLGTKALVISDFYQLPITPKSERLLFAAESTNPTVLAATIDKSMKTDPDARRREYNGHVIWEIVDEETALPMVTIENSPAFGPVAIGAVDKKKKPKAEEEEERRLPNSAITVAHGHLLVATHIDFLITVLAQGAERDRLSQRTDYQIVLAELDKIDASENCLKLFSRTDEVYRAVYELIRAGRMPEAETMFGRLLNSILGDGKDTPRNQEIDGSKLPDFETVRRYFGPAGITVTTEANGWFISGFTLSKGE